MSEKPPASILFASEAGANQLVAGVPAAVRVLALATENTEKTDSITIAVPGGWQPSEYCQMEAKRLAGDVGWKTADTHEINRDEAIWALDLLGVKPDENDPSREVELQALKQASKVIIASTGKAADGIVSRYINRPISQSISRIMLLASWTRPGHATALAALIGLAMIIALLFGGATGLLIGAVLFQAASIVDGVDGEMARATQRSSERGAMLDSLTDAATNLGFLAGVSFNVWQQGMASAAAAGAISCVVLGLGSALLGIVARRSGGPFTFDALKHKMRAKPSRFKQALIYIAMRDFYALAACTAILVGAVVPLLYAFAIIACGWFLVVCVTFATNRFAPPSAGS
ncbi:CDP-alcohol phosphatidyltransferase family protein [Erythrobacter sp. HA6-11]